MRELDRDAVRSPVHISVLKCKLRSISIRSLQDKDINIQKIITRIMCIHTCEKDHGCVRTGHDLTVDH